MTKKFITALLFLMSAGAGILAQENAQAFKNLSVGVELISTTGFGLEVATPLHSNFALRGGISILPFDYSHTFKASVSSGILKKIDDAIGIHPDISTALSQNGLPTKASNISTDVDAKGTLNFVNGKILVDYYPWATGAFHVTAGVYIGATKPIKLEGHMNDQAIQVLNVLNDHGVNYFDEPYVANAAKGYSLTGRDLINFSGELQINAVKPFLGIGYGRAIPKRLLGINIELGAYYQGTPKLIYSNPNLEKFIDDKVGDVSGTIKDFSVYPVLSFKLNFRVF